MGAGAPVPARDVHGPPLRVRQRVVRARRAAYRASQRLRSAQLHQRSAA